MYKIIDINWVRANLVIKFNKNVTDECFLCLGKNKIKLDPKKDEITISIYNTPQGESLEEGVCISLASDSVYYLATVVILPEHRIHCVYVILSVTVDGDGNVTSVLCPHESAEKSVLMTSVP